MIAVNHGLRACVRTCVQVCYVISNIKTGKIKHFACKMCVYIRLMYVCICVYVCMYLCMYVSIYVCVYVYMCVCMYVYV